jgi:hypothetical protein
VCLSVCVCVFVPWVRHGLGAHVPLQHEQSVADFMDGGERRKQRRDQVLGRCGTGPSADVAGPGADVARSWADVARRTLPCPPASFAYPLLAGARRWGRAAEAPAVQGVHTRTWGLARESPSWGLARESPSWGLARESPSWHSEGVPQLVCPVSTDGLFGTGPYCMARRNSVQHSLCITLLVQLVVSTLRVCAQTHALAHRRTSTHARRARACVYLYARQIRALSSVIGAFGHACLPFRSRPVAPRSTTSRSCLLSSALACDELMAQS